MVGLIGNLAKGALTKPKQKKVEPQKLIQSSSDKKEQSKPKGTLVPSPSGAIVKIIDVKAPVKKDFITGGDPALEQMNIINTKTFDIIKALKGQQDAKKKRAKSKKKLFQWMSRKNREEGREEKGEGLKIPLVGKIAAGAGNLLGAILKTLAILFAGWLTNYLPQIIEAVSKFVDIVFKIVNFVKPIAQLFWDIGKWIVGAGTKLAAMLVGVKPDDATENSIIQNLNEIQKRFPLLEAAFASFLVYKGLGGIKKIRQPGGKTNTQSKTSNVKPKTSKTTIKTSTKDSKLIRSRHGTNAQKIYDNARQNGKTVEQANAAVTRALNKGQIISKPDSGLSIKGKSQGQIFKHGLNRSVKRGALKFLGKGAVKTIGKTFSRIPIVGSLIVAVTQLLAGEPLGKALFMGVGAGLGGLLGSFIPIPIVGTLIGEALGLFVGELLYEGMMGKGWGAAGEKLKQTLQGLVTGAGNIGKAMLDWLFVDGLPQMLGRAGDRVKKWFDSGFKRFVDNFPTIDISGIWGLPRALGTAAGLIGLKDSEWVEDGKVNKIPNLALLTPLGLPFMMPHLIKSFFPPKSAEEKAKIEEKRAEKKENEPKKNILGITMGDEHQSDEYIKKRDSGQLEKVDAISESASYDKVEEGDTVIIGNDGGATPSGGGGGSSSVTLIGGSDFYRAAQLNRKKSNLARVWA